jgi:hypothetical protein
MNDQFLFITFNRLFISQSFRTGLRPWLEVDMGLSLKFTLCNIRRFQELYWGFIWFSPGKGKIYIIRGSMFRNRLIFRQLWSQRKSDDPRQIIYPLYICLLGRILVVFFSRLLVFFISNFCHKSKGWILRRHL